MGELWFVTGGARSGKSRFAERLAAQTGRGVVYLATMQPLDDELRRRVKRHRSARPAGWRTVEAPLNPAGALAEIDATECVLLDCLSLWVSNRLMPAGEAPSPAALESLEAELTREVATLTETAAEREGELIAVTNEVGAGIVPDNALARAYRDLLGRVNQQVASAASRAWLLVSGRALELPPGGEE